MIRILLVTIAFTFVNASLFGENQNAGNGQTQQAKEQYTYTAPSFCRDLDCPKYTVLKTLSNDIELRRYDPSVWATTTVSRRDIGDNTRREMFFKLFRYILGNNKNNVKIPMTAPVLMEVSQGQRQNSEGNFTMHFMIPFNLQSETAEVAPTDPSVFITTKPSFDAYVKSYGGYANEKIKDYMLLSLKNNIGDNTKFYDNHYFTAGYDAPYRKNNRHNEVWLLAKN